MGDTLKGKIVRLAHEHPEHRAELLGLLKEGRQKQAYANFSNLGQDTQDNIDAGAWNSAWHGAFVFLRALAHKANHAGQTEMAAALRPFIDGLQREQNRWDKAFPEHR